MSKDFQNGFALGRACGGVNSSPLTKEYLTEKLKEFKEKELDYTRIYKYDRERLENTNVLNTDKAFKVTSQIASHGQGATEISKVIWYQFDIAMAVKEYGKELVRLVDSPLNIRVQDNGLMSFSNIDRLKDIGVIADGYPIMYKEYLNREFVEDMGIATDCTLYFSAANAGDEAKRIAYLHCWLSIYVPSQEIAETLKAELDVMLAHYSSTFLLKYENIPEIEIVDAPYLGGN